VKRVLGLFTGFVWVIASPPHCFLYRNQRIHDIKKKEKKEKNKKKERKSPLSPSSFSSAPPPAIDISTPLEIIVRVSSTTDLLRPWYLLRGLSRLHPFTISGALGLPSLGLRIPFWFRSVLIVHARVDVLALYPALRQGSRLAFCTVGNPPSSVFVLLGCFASPPPPASHTSDPLAQYCYIFL